jgi:hypothetical protein
VTHHALSELAGKPAAPARADLPGLRVFRSGRFRIILALVLLIIGTSLVATMLMRQADAADGQFAIDFGDYYLSAERLAAGESPYAPEMLAGPTAAQGTDRYRYPPWFGQALQPLTGLSLDGAAIVWLVVQAAAIVTAVWIGSGVGGAAVTLERALWCGVAAAFFLPVFDALWKGNVSGVLALAAVLVALGGTAAGVAAGVATLLRAVPATLLPAVLASDARSRWSAVLVLTIAIGVGFVLAPAAWIDYPTVVANMLGGSTDYANNLAPAAVASNLDVPDLGVSLLRIATLALAAAAVAGSAWLARTREGLPAAALLGATAMLLAPGSLWYHYLVILLPFAAMAWPRAPAPMRMTLFAAAALISVSLVWLPLALLGAAVLAVASLIVIWPRSVAPASAAEPSGSPS